MENSIWTQTHEMKKSPSLKGDVQTDVLIIGGGLCGILTAYFLKWAGVDYLLVEANRIGSGVSAKTTAKISSLQGLIYQDLMKEKGKEKAQLYYQACQQALKRYECMSKNIDCDFEILPAYTYSRKDRKKIEEEVRTIRCIGGEAEFIEELSLPFGLVEAVRMPHQAQFHPLKFITEVTKELNVFENTRILKLSNNIAKTESGSIKAKKIIVATHFPFVNQFGGFPFKLYQERSYVVGLKKGFHLNGMYLDEAKDGLSFRNQGDVLLVGGNAHRTGKETTGWKPLRDFQERYAENTEEVFAWANQDCMTLDGLPYIGHYSWRTPDLFVATGFQKWGMTGSMMAALLLRDLVLERKNDFASLFSPQRSIFHKQLFVNGIETIKDFVAPSKKRCPHLGCVLKWNTAEHSWDCPCHGSRFSEAGELLDNPANGSLR